MTGHVALAFLASTIASVPSVGHAATDVVDREPALRAYIAELSGPLRLPDGPFAIEIQSSLSAAVSEADVLAQMSDLAERPDHPDHELFESQLQLARQPDVRACTLWFETSQTWGIEEIWQSLTLHAGEHNGTRWIWADSGADEGQMTLTKAGVPFPPGYDVGMKLKMYLGSLRAIANAGIAEGQYNIMFLDASDPAWSVMLEADDRSRVFLEGIWVHAAPKVTMVDFISTDGVGEVTSSLSFHGVTAGAPGWAAQAMYLRSDGIVETTRIDSLKSISRKSLESRAKYPEELAESEPGQVIRDYRVRGAAERDASPGASLLLFRAGEPAYRQTSANDNVVSTFEAPSELIPAGDGDSAWSGHSRAYLGGAICAMVFIGIWIAARHR
ncbi:MAG: hypothetical protein AAGI53_03225 [Planctomycetota bacterium]